MKPKFRALCLCFTALALAAGARADFSYEQETKVTGGAMHGVLKAAGVFSKRATRPARTRVVIKGPRMAVIGEDQISITDLDAETVTTLYPKKRRRTVVTFEQMRQYMELMSAKARDKKSEGAELDMSVRVEETGKTQLINGLPAKAYDIRLSFAGQDPKSGETGAMEMLVRSWVGDPVRGYSEVRDFQRKLAEKLDWAPGSAMKMMTSMSKASEKELAEIYDALAKIDGMPVMQQAALGTSGVEIGQSKPPAAKQEPREEASAGKSIKKALGGFGGFGGFGRKKNKEPEPPPPQEPDASGQQGPASLIELEIRYFNFSSAPVDAALVETEPAGYRLVKSDIEKALR